MRMTLINHLRAATTANGFRGGWVQELALLAEAAVWEAVQGSGPEQQPTGHRAPR